MAAPAPPDGPGRWLRRWSGRCVEIREAVLAMALAAPTDVEALAALDGVLTAPYAVLVGQGNGDQLPWRRHLPFVMCLSFISTGELRQEPPYWAARRAARIRGVHWCVERGVAVQRAEVWRTPPELGQLLERFYARVDEAVEADPTVRRVEAARAVSRGWGAQPELIAGGLEARAQASRRARRRLLPLYRNRRLLEM
jgi:hypothetical protein